MSYSIKVVCSDQDMSYPYSIKGLKEQDMSYSKNWFAQIRICHTALRRKSQHWFAQIRICHTYSIKEKEPTH